MHRAVLFFVLAPVVYLSACNAGIPNGSGLTDPGTPQPTDTVSGAVTFKGAPLAGATVTLWIANSNAVVSTATTDASGNYSFSGLSTSGNAPAEYQIWVNKPGYGFYPSLAVANANAKVERTDHTGQFVESLTLGTPMYFTVIDFVSLPKASLTGANFAAYDGSNAPVSVAATGQTVSYAIGDDGSLKKGVAASETRFADNHDGTATDNATGLVWLKNVGCMAPVVWTAALTSVNNLASGSCGLTDNSTAGQWRLPNLVEFETMIDASASNPVLPTGSPFTNVANLLYWTSTSYFGGEEGSPTAWAIRISDGRSINDGIQNLKATSVNGVWAVRGTSAGAGKLQATGLFHAFAAGDDGTLQMGAPMIFPRFIDNGNGTITDTMTSLVWLKQASCIQGDWAAALTQVNSLASGKCGLTDGSATGAWRVPNRNEIQSLTDRNQNNQADYFNYTFWFLDQTLFQHPLFINFIGYQYYWTSTTDAANPAEAWTVFSCDYGVYDVLKTDVSYTLAVRDRTN
jgi:hypothetical protein